MSALFQSGTTGGGLSGGGLGIPDGGTTGEALVKQSPADGDASWAAVELEGGFQTPYVDLFDPGDLAALFLAS